MIDLLFSLFSLTQKGVRLIAGLKTRVSMTSLANGVASVSPRQKLLLVFDFDNTFIEGNSDVLVFDLFKGTDSLIPHSVV
ncbi:unnamed protein product, partial [Cyprideis torosa]